MNVLAHLLSEACFSSVFVPKQRYLSCIQTSLDEFTTIFEISFHYRKTVRCCLINGLKAKALDSVKHC